jgi:raffinose/stachyose/melibiose transport system permease protein
VQTPISLLLGTFIAGQQRYRAFLAVLFFLPLLMSSAAIAIAFKSLLDPNFGLGAGLHLPFLAQDWLGNPTLAFITVIFVIAWQFIPFHTLLYQGGVRQIPEQMYEAAQIDGAGRVRQFFSITLPQLKYTIITSSTLMLVGSLVYFEPGEARDAAGTVGLPGRVPSEHPGRAGRCGAVHFADLDSLHPRPPPAAPWSDGGIR